MLKFAASERTKMLFMERRMQLEQNLLYRHEPGVSSQRYGDHDVVVSLTTYGRRIHSVWMAILSIMEQTMQANRIILWLDHSFENKPLPGSLQLLERRGLEVRFCDDLRSYKKLVPTLRLCPESTVVTIDDDAIYDSQLLEYLITPYLADPSRIYALRVSRIATDSEGALLPYRQWPTPSTEVCSHYNFFTGVGGVLYPPHSLDPEVLNEAVFTDICRHADDVWFKAMALKAGTPVCQAAGRSTTGENFLTDLSVQDMALYHINTEDQQLNDRQLAAVFARYNLYDKLPDCQTRK